MPLFSAASDILSLLHFSVKFFFSNIFFSERRTCLSSFDSEKYSIRKLFACQELFLFFLCCFSVFQQRIVCYHIVSDLSTTIFNFLGTFSLCSDSEIYITIGSHFCQHFLWFFYQYIVYLFQTSFFFLFIRKELILFPTFPAENLNFFEKPLTNPSYRRMMNPKRIVPVGKATTGIWTAAAK